MSRIEAIRPKIERAYKHIMELEAAIMAFKETNPYAVGPKHDPKTGRVDYCVVEAPDVPVDIILISGEILQNLRSALDYLVHQLVEVSGNKPNSLTGFPIFDSLPKYEAESHRKIELIRQPAQDAINAIKPYKGGNDTLWRLHRLNIRDKHRLLIVAGVALSSVDAFGHFKRIGVMPPQIDTREIRWRPVPIICPLKVGDIIFASPSTEVDEKIEFTGEIAFNESGVCEGEPLLETLHGMAQLVDNLVCDFIPLL